MHRTAAPTGRQAGGDAGRPSLHTAPPPQPTSQGPRSLLTPPPTPLSPAPVPFCRACTTTAPSSTPWTWPGACCACSRASCCAASPPKPWTNTTTARRRRRRAPLPIAHWWLAGCIADHVARRGGHVRLERLADGRGFCLVPSRFEARAAGEPSPAMGAARPRVLVPVRNGCNQIGAKAYQVNCVTLSIQQCWREGKGGKERSQWRERKTGVQQNQREAKARRPGPPACHFFLLLFFLPPCCCCCCLEEPAPEPPAACCATFSAAAATALGRPLTRPGCRGTSSATLSSSARPVGQAAGRQGSRRVRRWECWPNGGAAGECRMRVMRVRVQDKGGGVVRGHNSEPLPPPLGGAGRAARYRPSLVALGCLRLRTAPEKCERRRGFDWSRMGMGTHSARACGMQHAVLMHRASGSSCWVAGSPEWPGRQAGRPPVLIRTGGYVWVGQAAILSPQLDADPPRHHPIPRVALHLRQSNTWAQGSVTTIEARRRRLCSCQPAPRVQRQTVRELPPTSASASSLSPLMMHS